MSRFYAAAVEAAATATYASTVKHEVKAGVNLTKGQAVYVTSASGTNMIVGKASNASEATSSKVMGLIAATLSTNDIDFVITEGLLDGLNTSTANAGDPVWLGTDGNLIYGLLNKPVAPAHLVFIGIVTRAQQNNGEIFVKVQNGFELSEIHDVLLTSPANNSVLAYNSASGLWIDNEGFLTQSSAASTYAALSGAAFTGRLDVQEIREDVVSGTISANVLTYDYSAGNIVHIASAPSNNFTINFTNVPTDNGKLMSLSTFVTQGSTGYIPNAVQIGGASQTIKWSGGSAPTPTSSAGKIDIFTFTLLRLSSAWTVIGTSTLNI